MGVLLATARGAAGDDWSRLLDRAREAVDAGASTLCVPDHLDFPAGSSNLECWTLVTALASSLPGAVVLPLVLSAPLRAPGLLAAMASSLGEVAPGRVRVGLGAGVDQQEHEDAGARFGSARERVDLVAATAAAIADRAPSLPIVIAGGAPRMLNLAATRAAEWNCGQKFADRRREVLEALARACDQAGRAVRRSVLVSVLGAPAAPDGEMARRYNLHLALRGRTGDELANEVAAVHAEGFDEIYLAARTPRAWESILAILAARP